MTSEQSPNERQRPPTHLCPEHTGRQTQPGGCYACDQTRKRALLATRVRSLESDIRSYEGVLEAYEQQLAHLEDRIDEMEASA